MKVGRGPFSACDEIQSHGKRDRVETRERKMELGEKTDDT